ncbi:MAG TPA: class I SAM-dependent methyltransferase [Thermoanaerobaculia bacterium]|nr:class I SAM-dependent methyltransferase [Thermoanaerobaculia bacterium]
MATRHLSHEEARAFYDRFGRNQDWQRFYEDPAIDALLRRADFESARSVVELGCGTGRLAARLLEERLPSEATYAGFDLSRTMARLARERIAPWSDRTEIRLTDGSPHLPLGDDTCDRFLSAYVLDLLSEQEIHATLHEAGRVLAPGGRLCLIGLTFGQTLLSRCVCRLWTTLHSLSPRVVGGCRPLRLAAYAAEWQITHREVVCAFAICSEVLIAEQPRPGQSR